MKFKMPKFLKPEPFSVEDRTRLDELIERQNEIKKTFPGMCKPYNEQWLIRQEDRSINIMINWVMAGHILDLIKAGFTTNEEYVFNMASEYTQNDFTIVEVED